MIKFEFIKTTREVVGEIDDRYDIKTEKSKISKEEAISFLKEKNVFCGVGAINQNKGERVYFTLNKKYVVEIWDKELKNIIIFENFDEVIKYLERVYSDKNTIKIKMEIIPQHLNDIAIKYKYNIGN